MLGFRNLAGRPDAAWLSTAFAEMLTTELTGRILEASGRTVTVGGNIGAPLSAQESTNEIGQRERALADAESKLSGLEPFVAEGYISQEEFRAALS